MWTNGCPGVGVYMKKRENVVFKRTIRISNEDNNNNDYNNEINSNSNNNKIIIIIK